MPHRIGLFGGTFDPVHNGHISIVESFLASAWIDELWILLTPHPPHKQDRDPASYTHRKNMLEIAFNGMEEVMISTVEQSLPKPSYTHRTIEYLQKKYKEHTFFLCIGEDSLAGFNTWKYYKKILSQCELLVAERPDITHEDVEDRIMEKAHFIPHIPVDVSSTEIRTLIRSGKPVGHLIPAEVFKYIGKHELYK